MKASPSLLSKTELFGSFYQQITLFTLLFIVFSIGVYIKYAEYKTVTKFDEYITTALVQKQYKKGNHWVLKLHGKDGFSFYTTSKERLKPLVGYTLKIKFFTQRLTFLKFLKNFYVPSLVLSRLATKQKRYLFMQKLDDIHSKEVAPLFKALFFAGAIPKSLREKLSALGINHLLAISGFHLGVLSAVLFFILKIFYKPLQARFFPYRHRERDIAVLVFATLFYYLYFLDFPPSLLRAYAMSIFGYALYDRGIKLFSFSFVFFVISFLIALYPTLLFSLGFWFSVAGIYYILLFFHHIKELKVWESFILLNFWVYLAMLPIVHYFYGSFSLYQLYSPILTILFTIFYPLELFLHLISHGDLFDSFLKQFINIKIPVTEIFLPLWFFIGYIGLSLLAIFYKKAFYLLIFSSTALLACLFYGFA